MDLLGFRRAGHLPIDQWDASRLLELRARRDPGYRPETRETLILRDVAELQSISEARGNLASIGVSSIVPPAKLWFPSSWRLGGYVSESEQCDETDESSAPRD